MSTSESPSIPPEVEEELWGLLNQAEPQRKVGVDRLCAGHPHHEAAIRRFLTELEDLPTSISTHTSSNPEVEIGGRIGPYHIQRMLGQGGFGAVYLAERTEPAQLVALKVIKLGMDSRSIVQRFERERRALARMQHDTIAKVFDGGTTDRGQPYFVMEYIPGVPLTNYCNEQRLSVADRLRLFQQICAGVEHAHLKSVVHRDLTPRNILVMRVDGKAVPKVIDFGLAKVLEGEDEALSFSGMRIGTAAYMAPEQANPQDHGVDRRADVYALGVILHELLAGQLPFTSDELRRRQADSSLHFDTPRPSSKLRVKNAATAAIASERLTSVDHLRRILRNDLDWVVVRAMESDPDRRYPTAAALAEDLQRFLDHEPLHAGPPSALYRLRKFARRRRGILVGAAMVLAILATGNRIVARAETAMNSHREVLLAKAAAKEGRWPDVLGAVAAAEAMGHPDSVLLLLLRRQALESTNQVEEAKQCLAALDPGLDLGDHLPAIRLEQATDLLGNDVDAARRLVQEALDYHDRTQRGLSAADRLGALAMLTDSIGEARELLDRALAVDPGNYFANRAMIPILLATGDFDRLVILSEHLAALQPTSAEPAGLRVLGLLLAGRYREALGNIESVSSVGPENAEVFSASLAPLKEIDAVADRWSRQSMALVAKFMIQGMKETQVTPPPDLGNIDVNAAFRMSTAGPRLAKSLKGMAMAGYRLRLLPVLSGWSVPLLQVISADAPGPTLLMNQKNDHLLALTAAVSSQKGRLAKMRAARKVQGLTSQIPGLRRLELSIFLSYAISDRLFWQQQGAQGPDEFTPDIATDANLLLARPDVSEDELHGLAVALYVTEPETRWDWVDRIGARWEQMHGRTGRFVRFRAELLLLRGQPQEALRTLGGLAGAERDDAATTRLMERIQTALAK